MIGGGGRGVGGRGGGGRSGGSGLIGGLIGGCHGHIGGGHCAGVRFKSDIIDGFLGTETN